MIHVRGCIHAVNLWMGDNVGATIGLSCAVGLPQVDFTLVYTHTRILAVGILKCHSNKGAKGILIKAYYPSFSLSHTHTYAQRGRCIHIEIRQQAAILTGGLAAC